MNENEFIEYVNNVYFNHMMFNEFDTQYPCDGITALIDLDGKVISISKKSAKFIFPVDNSDISHHESRYMINMLMEQFHAAKNHLYRVIELRIKKIKRDHGKN